MIKTITRSAKKLTLALVCASAIGASAQAAPLYFYPAKPWEMKNSQQSCAISNQYNNGYIITFKANKTAGQKALPYVTINFRQNALKTGETYNTSFSLPGQKPKILQGIVESADTIKVPLANDPIFLKELLDAPTFNFILDGNDFNFSLVGLSRQAAQFKNCYSTIAPPPRHRQRQPHHQAQPLPTANSQGFAQQSAPTTLIPYNAQTNTPNAVHWNARPQQQMRPPITPPPTSIMQTTAPQAAHQNRPSHISANRLPKDLYQRIQEQTQPKANTQTIATNLPLSNIPKPAKKPRQSKQAAEKARMTMPSATKVMASEDLPILNSKDWTLEKATLRFQEAERQLKKMGQKIQKERARCKIEKKELEALLFDPQLTSEQQLAKLASLEEELKRTRIQMKNQELHYQERIKILQDQLDQF